MTQVVVIGGGFAGLSAAAWLSQNGHAVTLLERRQQLGGRAYSFSDPKTGDTIDNGQHLFMKCYRDTLNFLQLIGAEQDLYFQPRFHIDFQEPGHPSFSFSTPPFVPSPLHLFLGFLRFRAICKTDLLALRKLDLKADLSFDLSVDAWLTKNQQPNRLRRAFWHPLCIAALNEPPERASARQLQTVLREAFLSSAKGSLLGYSKTGLSNLYIRQARHFIEKHRGTIQFGASVKSIQILSDHKLSLTLRSGEPLFPNACICAVPPPALLQMLPPEYFSDLCCTLKQFQPSPILSVNLWFDRAITSKPFMCLLDTHMEWLFNKSALYGTGDQADSGHIALVTSAARHLAHKTESEVIALAMHDLQLLFPDIMQKAHLRHAKVVCEHKATYSLPLGQPPPDCQTKHPALFLAGDWTNTGLPCTIESAVRSGFHAAKSVHRFLKQQTPLVA